MEEQLIGINVLRDAGAVIDFGRNLALFEQIDPQTIIELEQAPSGHLLLSLVEDLLENKLKDTSLGNTLRAFVDKGKALAE